jgi:class 3 adenylate cyclase
MVPEEESKTLEEWAGSQHLNLTLAFTDIVKSTAIGLRLGDDVWIDDLFDHFSQAREIARRHKCYVVKVIGDSLMIAFRTSSEAVRFAVDFSINTGISYIGIRAGIHSGDVQIRDNDIYGLTVNRTSRIQGAVTAEGILVSDRVKTDFRGTMGSSSGIIFEPEDVSLESFGKQTLWRAKSESLTKAWSTQRRARNALLTAGWRPVPRMPR